MANYLGSNSALARLEPFLLIAKSAKGAAAAKLIQDAISAPGTFVFAELLESPNIQELANTEQHGKWFEILNLFSYDTYQDYKARSTSLPTLTPIQETKLKYLSLASMARSARILPYSQLQSSLDIHVLRDLEDLIIDAMYQDVIRGKLDQQQSTFEVEWSMGRDTKTEEIQGLLDALTNWSRMTGALLDSMDKKIKLIKDEQLESERQRHRNNVTLRENIKEISEKIQTSVGNRNPRKVRAGDLSSGLLGDSMEIDERISQGYGPRGPSLPSGSRLQEPESPSKIARKRNRGA